MSICISTLVEHTRSPIVSQFDLLVHQGIITLDHLIKRNQKGKVIKKGPLFKINVVYENADIHTLSINVGVFIN